MNNHSGPHERPCPDCGVVVPVHSGYVTWCGECGWNLTPAEPVVPRNTYERLHLKLGTRFGDQLLRNMLEENSLETRLTASKFLAGFLAWMVHLLALVFLGLGIWLIFEGWPNVVFVFIGICCVALAILARPHMSKQPEAILPREQFPVLYRLVDQVADVLGAKHVDGIIIDGRFNAAFGVIGVRRRHYLWLGLPLFFIHDNPERIALIGHELGHSVNGDSTRTLIIGSAINTLSAWYMLVVPQSLLSSESGLPGFVMLPANIMLYAIAGIIWSVLYVIAVLLYRDSQRAEYLADYHSAVVGGSRAGISSTSALYLEHIFQYTVQKVANNPGSNRLFDELRHQMTILPERELERVERVTQMEGTRIDITHPPTPHRIKFLRARHTGEPKVVISPKDSEQLNAELESLYDIIGDRILTEYRSSLYYS